MLGQLAYSMKVIEDTLIDIKKGINRMNEEVYRISKNLNTINTSISHANSQRANIISALKDIGYQCSEVNQSYRSIDNEARQIREAILEQTQAMKYANTASANAEYKHNWYIDQYRQGLL